MDLLDATLISSIESSINLYLKARPRAQQRLNELAGQSLRVTLEPSGQQTVILFAIDQIRVLREFEGDAGEIVEQQMAQLERRIGVESVGSAVASPTEDTDGENKEGEVDVGPPRKKPKR